MANDDKSNISEVEKLAKELCLEYQNPKFFKWYCGVIYEFGVMKIEELRKRVSDARQPGRLFTRIVNEWRDYKRADNLKRGNGQKDN